MVTVLCNPGVRDRHWHQMSEIVEYDLTPDSGTTLRKVLKQDLTPYLERFESISASASKVRFLVFKKYCSNVPCYPDAKPHPPPSYHKYKMF